MIGLIFTLASFFNGIEGDLQLVEDIKPLWKTVADGKFQKYNGQSAKAIHFSTEIAKKEGAFLQIRSKSISYLFINSTLVARGKFLSLRADSLRKVYGSSFFVSIYQKGGIDDLSTKWASPKTRSEFYNPSRPAKSFHNFVILATLLLIILLTGLLRSNPQLTLDYLNVIKLFSFKHRDDSQFVLRVTSSVNLLFYFFCSLLTSLAILIASYNSTYFSFSIDTASLNTGGHLIQWFLVSLLIAALLMFKLGLASLLSMLFEWRNTAGFQFFNFVRVLVISLILIGVITIFCFSININLNYYFLVKCFCGLLSIGAGLMFFKLLNRESASPFHLFSYLCATEIFPLVILIKEFLF